MGCNCTLSTEQIRQAHQIAYITQRGWCLAFESRGEWHWDKPGSTWPTLVLDAAYEMQRESDLSTPPTSVFVQP